MQAHHYVLSSIPSPDLYFVGLIGGSNGSPLSVLKYHLCCCLHMVVELTCHITRLTQH